MASLHMTNTSGWHIRFWMEIFPASLSSLLAVARQVSVPSSELASSANPFNNSLLTWSFPMLVPQPVYLMLSGLSHTQPLADWANEKRALVSAPGCTEWPHCSLKRVWQRAALKRGSTAPSLWLSRRKRHTADTLQHPWDTDLPCQGWLWGDGSHFVAWLDWYGEQKV